VPLHRLKEKKNKTKFLSSQKIKEKENKNYSYPKHPITLRVHKETEV